MTPNKEKLTYVSKINLIKSNSGSYSNRSSMVYVNPTKFNSRPTVVKNGNRTNHILCHDNKRSINNSISKVYINPNFKKPPPSSQPKSMSVSSKTESVSKQVTCVQYTQWAKSREDNASESNKQVGVSSQSDQTCPSLEKSHKIFINPNYTKPSNTNSSTLCYHSSTAVNKSVKTENVKNVGPSLKEETDRKTAAETSSGSAVQYCNLQGDKCQQINVCINRRSLFNKKESTKKRRKKSEENVTKTTKTIFINPKFESRLQDSNNTHAAKKNEYCLNATPQTIPVLITDAANRNRGIQKESSIKACSSKPVLDFPGSSFTGRSPTTQSNTTKQVIKRKRTSSSSLVVVSTTKLIRKRKLSQTAEAKVKTVVSNQPVFLSKTKLVRVPPNKGLNNKLIGKTKVKRILPRHQLQMLTPDKITRLRKQSFTNSLSNLVNVVPNCTSVTKIKSKNGKSLRLLRKSVDPNKSKSELISKNVCSIQNKKIPLKQQLKKDALCLVNKLGKTQFSKINVVQMKKKVPHSRSESKYVYKKRDSTSRLSQTKSLVSPTKQHQTPYKVKINNYHTDKYNFIRSKYRMIRKQNSKATNKSGSCKKDYKYLNPSMSSSKQKCKVLHSGLKTSLTRKKLSIVNIGGIFYRCSRTSLTRNKSSPSKVSQSQGKGLLLNIRGQKFQFENNGQTLRCLDNKPGRKRIDIGGVTFIKSSSGSSLTRTNYHTARSIIVQAKQKSLSQLTRKHKKNNEPCPFFHRLGRCAGKDRGFCVRLHDPKYIAVCKKSIQGLCKDPKCLLSHKFSSHNMPTCQHFLAGHCGRDLCPYPHVKVNDNAPICLDFLRGFCSLGDQCLKRHIEICPSFEKGLCSRGKYCPYPHPKSKSHVQLKGKLKHLQKEPQPPRAPEPVSSYSLRYFEDVNLQNENKITLHEDLETTEECDSEVEDIPYPLKKRPKLGRLPSFIPLSLDESCNDYNSE